MPRTLPPRGEFAFTVVTGPRRRLARGGPGVEAAPFGDMMLSGCFGLVAAFLELEQLSGESGRFLTGIILGERLP